MTRNQTIKESRLGQAPTDSNGGASIDPESHPMKLVHVSVLVCLWACTSSDAVIEGGVDSGIDASDPGPLERRIFVTNAVQNGNMGGIPGADGICAEEADMAGLDGEFKAWLSTLSSPAVNRLLQSDVPYVLVDGTRVADNWGDLTDDSIQAPINLDAAGQVRGGDVWTGTLPSGASYMDGDCEGFRSNSSEIMSLCGSTQFTNTFWTAAQTPDCSVNLRLFCIEQ